MRKIRALVKGIDTISEWSGRIFSIFIIGIIVLSVYEVFTRRFLGKPTIWTHEIIGYCFAGAVLLLMGYTTKYKAHANADVIYEHFSTRTQATLDLITYILFLGIFSTVLFYEGLKFAAISWSMMERTPSAFNFYIFPAKTLLPVGVFLLILQMISDIIKRIVFLVKGESL
ncbi:MAG: TRAP transporter small permease subunit [Deltaproteobacteria bacterium]|nr:TRAP transporter small permease subunit [Deltaproteobacteria bacterium]